MGRPKKANGLRHFVGVKLDDELIAYVEALAEELKVGKSVAVREMLRFATLIDPREAKALISNNRR